MNKALVLAVLVVLLTPGLVGCVPADISTSHQNAVYLINGSLGDGGRFDDGQAGMDAIAQEYGVKTITFPCDFDHGKYFPSLIASAESGKVVYTISDGFEDDLEKIAEEKPGVTFVNITSEPQRRISSTITLRIRTEESLFLSGVVAGLVTLNDTSHVNSRTKKVGFIGGDRDQQTIRDLSAFQNGVFLIDPGIHVQKISLDGDWDNADRGKQAALELYDQGVIVILSAAGMSGQGILQAAQENGLYTITIAPPPSSSIPASIVAVNIEKVGVVMEKTYPSILEGSIHPGETIEYGLKDDSVDLVLNLKTKLLTPRMIERISIIRQQIIDGKIIIEPYADQDIQIE